MHEMNGKRRAVLSILFLYLFCAVYLVPVYPHFISANELAHWVIDASLVEHGALDVRWSEPLIGKLVDSTRSGQSIYSNKPPGLALTTMPAYLAARALFGPPDGHNLRLYLYFMRLVGATLPLGLLAALFIRRRGADPFALAALLFGTCLFFLGMLLFSHVLAGLLLYVAYIRLFDLEDPERARRNAILGGAAAGFATLVEYPAAISVVVFGAVLLAWRDGRKKLPWFVAGGLPFAIVLGVFNRIMFHSFFALVLTHQAWPDTAAWMSRGLWGFGVPTPAGLWQILFSPAHGLFFYSPVLLLALPAFRPRDPASWARLLAVGLTILVISSYPASHGGWGAGTRYLALLVPLIADALPRPAGHGRMGPLAPALLGFSTVLCVLPALTFVFSPPDFPWVHGQFFRPLLARGFYVPNLGALVSPGPWTLLPAVVAVIAALAIAMGGKRAVPGAALGLIAGLAIAFIPVGLSPFLLIERQVVVETYFRPEGEIAAVAGHVRNPSLARQLQDVAASIAAARRYPPNDWPYGK